MIKDGITAKQLMEMIKKQNHKCALSGVELTPQVASVDHIVPLEKNGAHSIENIHIVHSIANRMKSTMDQEEFIRWCRLIADNKSG